MSTKMKIIGLDLCHFAFKSPFEQSFQPTANQICKTKLKLSLTIKSNWFKNPVCLTNSVFYDLYWSCPTWSPLKFWLHSKCYVGVLIYEVNSVSVK